MSEHAVHVDRLLYLAEVVCDDIASDEELGELNAILLTDEAYCREYLDYYRMRVMLRLELRAHRAVQNVRQRINSKSVLPSPDESGIVADETPSTMPVSFPGAALHGTVGYFSSGWPVAYLVATVIFGVGLLVGSILTVSHSTQVADSKATLSPPSSSSVDTKMEFVGRITGMVDCQWSEESTAAFNGAKVPLGRKYALSAGLMEITYNSGAKVILQGPCTYEVESKAGGYLLVGKLTARVEKKVDSGEWIVDSAKQQAANPHSPIPNPSLSTAGYPLFTIKTPTATITDLGTEFGVEVTGEGSTTSQVFRGQVEVQVAARDGQQGQTIQLTENESVQVEKRGDGQGLTLRRVVAEPTAFVRHEQFPALAKESRLKLLRRWQAYSRQVRKDPALVAYYPFEAAENGNTRTLPNLSAAGHTLDGQIEGPEWVDGRLPGKYALLFHGPGSGDKVVLPEPDRFNFPGPFSVAVWFKVLQFGSAHAGLVTKGNQSWRFQQSSERTELKFDTNYGPTLEHGTAGRVEVADRRWHLGVAVYEPVGNAAQKRLYVDGRLDVENESPLSLNRTDQPVWLGANSGCGAAYHFEGWIDEVAIFERALSAEEIQKMYDAGNPARSTNPKSNENSTTPMQP